MNLFINYALKQQTDVTNRNLHRNGFRKYRFVSENTIFGVLNAMTTKKSCVRFYLILN